MQKPTVQIVSKPIAPPFRDGTRCLVRDLVRNVPRYAPLVLGTGEGQSELSPATIVPLYQGAGSFAPSLGNNLKALAWLLGRSRADLWHFVFAPNPASSQASRWLHRLRRVPTIQTIPSAPRSYAEPERLLFGDVIVAQSEHTRRQFLAAYEARALRAPGIEVIAPAAPTMSRTPNAAQLAAQTLGLPQGEPFFLYPGDLEMSRGAARVLEIAEQLRQLDGQAAPWIVVAYRAKTPQATAHAQELARQAVGCKVKFLSETPHIHALLECARAIVFPVDDLYGKVDHPIVLLEALQLGTPVLVTDEGPLPEIPGVRVLPFRAEAWARVISAASSEPFPAPVPGKLTTPAAFGAAYEALYDKLRA